MREMAIGRGQTGELGEQRPGTYALLLRAAASGQVEVGRHGVMPVRRGWYVYVGSARGPGGLRARLAHHLRPVRRPHWHVDYLRQRAAVREIWAAYNRRADEHRWAKVFAVTQGVQIPGEGFGSSDCACRAHLFFFRRRPGRAIFDHAEAASRPTLAIKLGATVTCGGWAGERRNGNAYPVRTSTKTYHRDRRKQ